MSFKTSVVILEDILGIGKWYCAQNQGVIIQIINLNTVSLKYRY